MGLLGAVPEFRRRGSGALPGLQPSARASGWASTSTTARRTTTSGWPAAGRAWSLLRNRLCALASVSGGFGFTCGVEWLARGKDRTCIPAAGLSWGSAGQLVAELARLNRLLAEHPVLLRRREAHAAEPGRLAGLALRRDSAEGLDSVLVLVNTDDAAKPCGGAGAGGLRGTCASRKSICWAGSRAKCKTAKRRDRLYVGAGRGLLPGALAPNPAGLSGDEYRRARAQSAWAITALSQALLPEEIGPCPWRELAARVEADAREFLGSLAYIDRGRARTDLSGALEAAKGRYRQVVVWSEADRGGSRRCRRGTGCCWRTASHSGPA